MRRLPPKRIGRLVGMGQNDTIPTTDVLQAGDIGTPTINANSVPEGSSGQVSTGSGTLNAITPSPGGDVLQLSPITVYGTVPTTGGGGGSSVQPVGPATAMASMTILGLPWWVVLAAVGVATVFAALEMRGPRRTGTRRRKRTTKRAAARRRTPRRGRRGGRRRNPVLKRRRRPMKRYDQSEGGKKIRIGTTNVLVEHEGSKWEVVGKEGGDRYTFVYGRGSSRKAAIENAKRFLSQVRRGHYE